MNFATYYYMLLCIAATAAVILIIYLFIYVMKYVHAYWKNSSYSINNQIAKEENIFNNAWDKGADSSYDFIKTIIVSLDSTEYLKYFVQYDNYKEFREKIRKEYSL